MPPGQHARVATTVRSWARRGLAGAALRGVRVVTGMAFTGQAAAAAVPPGLGVRQPGVELAEVLIDPTASTALGDVRLSPNGVALGDVIIGDPDATPPVARTCS